MFITTAEAARRLGVNRRTVLIWIQTKGIPAYRFSGIWRIDDNDLEKWIADKKINVKGTRGGNG